MPLMCAALKSAALEEPAAGQMTDKLPFHICSALEASLKLLKILSLDLMSAA
jgi:hypothetical protein